MAAGSRNGRSTNSSHDETDGEITSPLTTQKSNLKDALASKWTKVALFAAVILFIVVAIVVAFTGWKRRDTPIRDHGLILEDCHPDQGKTDEEMRANCEVRGCSWNEGFTNNTPKCSFPPDYENYAVLDVTPISANEYQIVLNKTSRPSGFKDDSEQVLVQVQGVDDHLVRIRVTDKWEKRWEPPLPVLAIDGSSKASDPLFNITADDQGLIVTRASTGGLIFQTFWKEIIFSRQYIQLRTNVSSNSLFGLGERVSPHEKTVSGSDPNERQKFLFLNYGSPAARSGYGTHPFYLMYENETEVAHGVLLLNSNPMEISFSQTPSLTYRTIGGILDFLVFMGPTASDVLKQKADVIGHSPMPPYWSLGFHLCRWGYWSVDEMRSTFEANQLAGVPVDAQWADIDYMDHYSDFTYDKKNFNDLPEFVDYLHKKDRRFVPILDPALAYNLTEESAGYSSFKRGLELDIFVKNTTGHLLLTQIWNPISVIPDYTHPKAGDWWSQQLDKFYKDIPWDGLWIDMNEPATMGYDGQIGGCRNDTLDRPQFNPAHPNVLEHQTICMSSQHAIGPHYNVHNMYSMFQAKMTYEAMIKIRTDMRPFILSRASYTGQGSYAGHWTGDVDSSWEHMRASIPSSMDFNLFGIPMVGADICGFMQNTTRELCARWSSLGAFYSFSRNHNMYNTVKQDPASLGGEVLEAAKKALDVRYSLLPYLYTLFYNHTMTAAPVIRSLTYNYPLDMNARGIETQFMWGEGILINPVLFPGETEVDAYFPAGRWYDYTSKQVIASGEGSRVKLNVPITDINVSLRGGHIFPTIPSVNLTTSEQRNKPFTLITAFDEDEKAFGDLFWDDGEKLDSVKRKMYNYVTFNATAHSFKSHCNQFYDDGENLMLVKDLAFLGVDRSVESALFADADGKTSLVQVEQKDGVLTIHLPENTDLRKDFFVNWKYQ